MRLIFILVFGLLASQVSAQGPGSNKASELIREVMTMDNSDGELTMNFWIPTNYWEVTAEATPDVTPEIAEQLKMIMKPYIIVLTAHTPISTGLGFDFADETTMRNSIKLVDSEGNKYKPLKNEDVEYDAMNIIGSMKPVFSQMIGEMGRGMHFYIFENVNAEGEPIVNEDDEGSFTIIHSGRSFRYSTPLVALMPPKNCPVDNVQMKGNWKFCPIHGVELPK